MAGEGHQGRGMRGLIESLCLARDHDDPQELLALFCREGDPLLLGISSEALDRGIREIAERHAHDAISPARVRLAPHEIELQEVGRLGWAIGFLAAQAEFEGGSHEFQVRFSGVAEREDGAWRWRHLHFSVAPIVAIELSS